MENMDIKIDFTKSAQDNADDYYKKSKKLVLKKQGAEKAVNALKDRLDKAEKANLELKKKKPVKIVEKEWYEKFHWFFTSDSMMVIAGKDAHQNETLNSKYFEENDLFFHANIFGAPVTILKGGASSGIEIRQEVAQFSASYSSAWKEGLSAVDVYAMKRDQVSKSTSKGSLGTGSFLLSGERDWYRSVRLSLIMFLKDDRLQTVPFITFEKIKSGVNGKIVMIEEGKDKKSDAAKKISKILGYDDLDAIMQSLPTGMIRVQTVT
jgi:predicted ribosome quality control (RQC) complex YloA/Tae2 family protein